MKSILLGLICLVSASVQVLEYEPQFENDQICVARAKIEPHEEIELHRDVYPQVVIALKGGTITRLEADGRVTEVQFPTGVAVIREPDPENELHKSVNNSSESVELVIIHLKNSPPILDKKENSHDVSVNIKINCPISDEFQEFVKSIPSTAAGNDLSFDEWKSSFVKNMNQLVHLVESEQVFNSWWSVNTDYCLPQEVKGE
jgi:hypothetical protein